MYRLTVAPCMSFSALGRLRQQACPQSYRILRAAIQVHNWLGAGHPSAAYREALAWEFTFDHIGFWRQPFQPAHPADFLCMPGVAVHVADLNATEMCDEVAFQEILEDTGLALGLLLDFGRPSLQARRLGAGPLFNRAALDAA